MAGRGEDREILIVDAENQEVGAATRRRMHIEKLVHRAIHGIVYDQSGRVYLSQRDDVVGQDQLDVSVTEHVWPGESFDQTARRAWSLRLAQPDAKPTPLTEIFHDYDVHPGGEDYEGREIVDDRFMQIYVAPLSGPITFDTRVYKGGEWRSPAEVDALVAEAPERFTSHFLKDWARVRKQLEVIVERAAS